VDAIGAERVHTIMMPSQFTADISKNDAKTQAELLGVEYDSIAINPLVEVFEKSLAHQFHGLAPNVAEENIQARIRGTLLMAVSNKKGYMVLATGNKSEMSVGYSTLYGDMCGGFAPLKDIPKTMVYRLCHYRNTLSYAIPDRVITRPPSAELAEDQKDEDSLPPYSILDEILDRYIDKDQDPRHIHSAGFDQETVNKVVKMVDSNEYKRRQAPIGIRTTQRAFGKDRRYPITSGYKRNIE
jgi:NAD+ synthase (glutamine-hydrolysing)